MSKEEDLFFYSLFMKSIAVKNGLMPEGLLEYEFDILSEGNKVRGLHYWTGKKGKIKHHYKKIENNILLDKLADKFINSSNIIAN